MRNNLRAGQKLWYVPVAARFEKPREVEVTKVGRRWAHLGECLRVDLETLRADGGGFPSPGRCYLSRETWEQKQALNSGWESLRKEFFDGWPSKRPPHVTLEIIAQIRALLSAPQEDASE